MCKVRWSILIAASCSGFIGACSHNHSQVKSTAAGRTGDSPVITQDSGRILSADEVFGYTAPNDPRFDVSLNDIRRHVRDNSATIIDARGTGDYEMGHVRGAMNVPASRIQSFLSRITQIVPKDRNVIIYCNGPHCDSAEMVSDSLAAQGYTNTHVFKPGWKALSGAKDIQSK